MCKSSLIIVTLFTMLIALPEGRAQNTAEPTTTQARPGQASPAETAPAEDPAETTPAETNEEPVTLAEQTEEPQSDSPIGFAAALKVGGTFHTIFNELKPFVVMELEGGVLLLKRQLEIDLAVGWARPPTSSDGTDGRLTAGDYDWEIKQDFLSFAIVGRYRFLKAASKFNVNAALGPKLFLLRSVTTGSAGDEQFGENKQFETRFGGFGGAGAEFKIGPGAILLDVVMNFGNLDGFITGDTSTASLDALLGYRLLF